MFILDQIPTVDDAQASLDALTREHADLVNEEKALSKRLKEVEARIRALSQVFRPECGQIGRARDVLDQAKAAAVWDAAPVVMVKTLRDGTTACRFSHLTAKQVHLFTTRGSTRVVAFSRETGTSRRGDQVLNLEEVLAIHAAVPRKKSA
jgi:Holliday junction resolvasome RuvABC endonuclease subunit